MIAELWHAVERYLRVVYIEPDVLFTRSPTIAISRCWMPPLRDPSAMAAALTEHLESNEREVVKSLAPTVDEPRTGRSSLTAG